MFFEYLITYCLISKTNAAKNDYFHFTCTPSILCINQPEQIRPDDALIPFDPLIDHKSLVKPDFSYSYMGTSFGLTERLFGFWYNKCEFQLVHLRNSVNPLTGEHSCIMLRVIGDDNAWLSTLTSQFKSRFVYSLFQTSFCTTLSLSLANSLLRAGCFDCKKTHIDCFDRMEIDRLKKYWTDLVDWRTITDLVRKAALEYFSDDESYDPLKLTEMQSAIIIGIGLQGKSLETVSKELKLAKYGQTRGLFNRALKIITGIGGSSQNETKPQNRKRNPTFSDLEDREISLRDVL